VVTGRDVVRSLPNVAGAAMVYFYFSYVDPWGVQPRWLQDLVIFVVVTGTIVVATFLSSLRLFRPLQEWRERLHQGADPAEVPAHLRRRALNLVRLGATFFVTSVLPPLLMMMVSLSLVRRFGGELPEEMRPLWMQLLHTQAYIVVATGGASFVMAQVAAGDLDVRVQVRS